MALLGTWATQSDRGYGGDGFDMGMIPPPPPVSKGGSDLLTHTLIKGRHRKTLRVIQYHDAVGGLRGWQARIETAPLGYPDNVTPETGQVFSSTAEASMHLGTLAGQLLKDGWTLCENWASEHKNERMQSYRMRLAASLTGKRATQPKFLTIHAPAAYHLASYIKVTTDTGEPGGVKDFYYDYPSADAAFKAAKQRVDTAQTNGYEFVAQSAAVTGENVSKAGAAAKLALTPPVVEDYSGLIKSFEVESQTGAALMAAEVQTHNHLDKRFLKRICELQPVEIAHGGRYGMFFPSHVHQEIALVKFDSTTYRLTVNGMFSENTKPVGGPGMMPAMSRPKSFAEINATPPEPPKLRHIEFED